MGRYLSADMVMSCFLLLCVGVAIADVSFAVELARVVLWIVNKQAHNGSWREKQSRAGKPDQGRENLIKDPRIWMLMGKMMMKELASANNVDAYDDMKKDSYKKQPAWKETC
ncbi:leishmanolysin-like peptidase [Dorcoceras hygrometricum]|uniref:Leishmanolysin-like peptidase n=1 Tax=Dorcoceras hygrometricum TaxID=472368 RepID=A0A2Z7CVH9_9LAMI|nr:leishmanolysin-like peptidase [Dorcoceras hygrometricum]